VRIGFNARALAAPQMRGWTRYALQLLRHLPQFGAELVLFCDQPLNPENLAQLVPGSFRIIQAPPMRYLAWEQAWLPVACARERVDVLHAPANYGLPLLAACPRVLTLHDAIDLAFEPVATPSSLRDRALQASFWAARHAACEIITVSAHAKADLVKYFAIPSTKITVVHEASDMHERAVSMADEQRVFDELLVDAFRAAALDEVSLVLVGGKLPASLRAKVGDGNRGAIYATGFVPDAALAALYRRAQIFVYPSLYEGFGLQLCEAMSFGCPTIAANATSLPEVLGFGGETFSPTSVEALVSLLRRITRDDAYRRTLSERATLRAQDFSWQQTAKLTYEIYARCVG
jgi:glycosyltransferase involved in cell wall biosynthesis